MIPDFSEIMVVGSDRRCIAPEKRHDVKEVTGAWMQRNITIREYRK
jgi:hypothetical protein